ncbi:hypothetical protein RND71_017552 [Anisodus tanguticus]|uniref:Pentatricopeptide repeat-containing protein n=1 Tax=Anisodus tanguticus TaxID=243964 RepID=A0AAE1S2I6_9SOLA|nr:hypothetical protein RND71_017552 [Anisodus tanguticus]
MRRLTSPLTRLHLHRCICSSATNQSHHQQLSLLSLSKPHLFTSPFSLSLYSRSFSTQPNEQETTTAQSLSSELVKELDAESLSIPQRLDLSFSHITLTPTLILTTLNISPDAGRTALGLFKWVKSKESFNLDDEVVSYFVDYFGRRKDFKAANDVVIEGLGIAGRKTLESMVDRLVRAGRPTQTVAFFENMEKDYGLVRDLDSLKLVVAKLCEHGFASYAEKMVKSLASEFFPDEYICDMLIRGWCIDGKLDGAQRLAGEMYRGGFEIGTSAYNGILDCVCKLCRKKDPFRLQNEAENVLLEMEEKGVPRDVETFNVLITNLCKIRKTEDALNLFYKMGEWGCNPDETTFLTLIRSLYQAARVDRMKSAGFGDALDKKAYYDFLKILCGIERIDHAMSVFAKMKEYGCKPGLDIQHLSLTNSNILKSFV